MSLSHVWKKKKGRCIDMLFLVLPEEDAPSLTVHGTAALIKALLNECVCVWLLQNSGGHRVTDADTESPMRQVEPEPFQS